MHTYTRGADRADLHPGEQDRAAPVLHRRSDINKFIINISLLVVRSLLKL